MTSEEHRTVIAARDLPRVRRWVTSAIRDAVNDSARAFADIRNYADHLQHAAVICAERNQRDQPCDRCDEAARVARQFVALLPDIPAVPERRADAGKEDSHDRDPSDVRRRRGRARVVNP